MMIGQKVRFTQKHNNEEWPIMNTMLKFLPNNAFIKKELEKIFRIAKETKCAVAFWGKDGSQIFRNSKSKNIKIVCNLTSGSTNPVEISKLQNKYGKNSIRMKNDLHAKVFWTDKAVIIGSANVSANGLALEGPETTGLEEVAVLIRDPIILKQTESWFNHIWKRAMPINRIHLDDARKIWHNLAQPGDRCKLVNF